MTPVEVWKSRSWISMTPVEVWKSRSGRHCSSAIWFRLSAGGTINEDGRSGAFVIGNDHFPISLMDLPCVVESCKTYDDSARVRTADIGQVW
ncbi:hypothetical protein QYF36_001563 [Acer negundo]|nr:hypothetical protein QYF36_001563 [Acer negundo]